MCEACYAIYPLYDAILQYTIETLVLDANILRDSILVRLEMVARTLTLNLTLPCIQTRTICITCLLLTLTVSLDPILGTVRGFSPRERHYVAHCVPGVTRLDKRQEAES